MRQYRGIPIDGKDFVYGWYMEHPFKDDPQKPLSVIVQDEVPIEVVPETVGQYTGLKDKKRTEEFPEGQEIYEGDILIDNNEWGEEHQPTFRQEGDIVEVVWLNSEAEYMFENITNPKDGHMIMSANRELEVIGTIHTHPELLSERK